MRRHPLRRMRDPKRVVFATLVTFVVIAMKDAPVSAAQGEAAFKYPLLVLEGRLANTLVFDRCEYISGMTCRITLKRNATLPSRVFFSEYGKSEKQLGRKLRLIYPNLKPGESGRATFRLQSST